MLPTLHLPPDQAANLVICTTGVGNKGKFTCLMSEEIPDIQLMFNGQCFPAIRIIPWSPE